MKNFFQWIFIDLEKVLLKTKKLRDDGFKSRYFIYILLMIFMCFFVLNAISIGKASITDWLSAISDVIMACSAITGVIVSKNWLSQATVQEGVSISLIVKDEILPKHDRILESLTVIYGMDVIVSSYLEAEDKKVITEFYDIIIDGYNEKINALESSKDSIKINYEKLLSRGWKLTPIKYEFYRKMMVLTDELLYLSFDTLNCLKSIKYRQKEDSMKSLLELDAKSSYEVPEIIEIIKNNKTEYNHLHSQFKIQYKNFYEGEAFIKFYFERH